MAGLAVLFIIFLYVFIGRTILDKVQKKYKTEKSSLITLALIILIPTWDVILGFPIYASLCLFQSGPKIYKTVDNVEGYYIGEVSEHDYRPLLFEEDYRYIDYKLKSNGKYYRSYWLKDNTSELCIQPDHPYNSPQTYSAKFRNGQCVAVEQIRENDVSKWEVVYGGESKYIPIIRIKYGAGKTIRERESGKILGKQNSASWCGGWVNSSLSIIVGRGYGCYGSTSCGRELTTKSLIMQVLKVEKLGLYNQPKKIKQLKPIIPISLVPQPELIKK